MEVSNFWNKISHEESCRIFISKGENDSFPELEDEIRNNGIFAIPESEQPVLVIDNTHQKNTKRHATIESPKIIIEDLNRPIIEFEVSVLEQEQGGIPASTIIFKFFSSSGELISDEKFTENIGLGGVKRISRPISAPKNAKSVSVTIFVNSSNKISIAYSGFYFGEVKTRKDELDERKTVTMFVFNNFSNDTRVLREAKSLNELGLRVRVIAVLSSGQKTNEVIDGIEVTRLQLSPFHLRLLKRWSSKSILDKFRRRFVEFLFMPFHRYLMFNEFDKMAFSYLENSSSEVFHSHDLNTLRAAVRLSKHHGSKLVYDSHELYLDRNRKKKAGLLKRYAIKRFEGRLIKNCDEVITVNQSIAEILENRYGIGDVNVVMNTPPMQFFSSLEDKFDLRRILQVRDDHKIAIYVGSIQYNRGIENLMKSLQYMENVHLVLMGYGDEKLLDELDQIAEDLDVKERYSKFGPVHSELVPQYTSSADIGVAPILNSCLSYYLCSPNKVFEYMHAGIPVVCSDFPELRKVVIGEGIGELFDPNNPKDIAESISRIIDDDRESNRYKINSINGSRKYNWGIQSRSLQSIYSRLILDHDFRYVVEERGEKSRIEAYVTRNGTLGLSMLGVENSLPGSSDWGSPNGKESSEIIRAKLNSQLYQQGDEISIGVRIARDMELTCNIFRIGYYGGQGGRRIAHVGKKEVGGASLSGSSENYEDEGVDWSEEFSIQVDGRFHPGAYVVKIGTVENSIILPFWIQGSGDVLAVVPSISNRIHSFSSKSMEKKAIYTHGVQDDKRAPIRGSVNYSHPNGRGGKISKWVFPFCRWAERNDIQVSWITDLELHKTPSIIDDYSSIILLGDSRFWTEKMHGMFGEHISSGRNIINIGCGMGEQIISIENDGSFELIANLQEGSSGALCERWSITGSPTKFGGRTEDAIELEVGYAKDLEKFELIGSWDSRKEGTGTYNVKNISKFFGELSDSNRLEISSDEIRSHSGSTIFLASMENWSDFLDDSITQDSDFIRSLRDYLCKLITNSSQNEKNTLKAKREAIEYLAKENWGAKTISLRDELEEREKNKIERVCILSSIWQRDELTRAFLKHLNFLKEEISDFKVDCVIVGSEGERSRKMVEDFGHHYVEEKNKPLSRKWNTGLKNTKIMNPDVVIVLGSDDFTTPRTIQALCESISEGRLMSGLMDMHILDLLESKMYHWNGYVMNNPHRRWETIGMARCMSKKLLEKIEYSLWDDEDIDRGLDGQMTRKLSRIGMIPIPFGEEVWLELDGAIHAFGHVGMYSTEIGGFAVDVKSGQNITPLERYKISEFQIIENYEEVLIDNLGEAVSEEINSIGGKNGN